MYLLLTVYSMRRHTSKMHYKEDDLVGKHSVHCRKLRTHQSTKAPFREQMQLAALAADELWALTLVCRSNDLVQTEMCQQLLDELSLN